LSLRVLLPQRFALCLAFGARFSHQIALENSIAPLDLFTQFGLLLQRCHCALLFGLGVPFSQLPLR
jgi:hypothetical protein